MHGDDDGDGDGPVRRALVEAAGTCFAEFGFERTTAAAIADSAGVSTAEFSAHFASREDAFYAVTALVFEKLLAAQCTPTPPDADPRVVLASATAAVIEVAYSTGRLFSVIEERAAVDPVVGEQLTTVHSRILRRFTRFIEQINATGQVTPCAEPAQIARKLSDAQWAGVARLIGAPQEEQRRFVVEMIAASERFLGFREVADLDRVAPVH